MFALHRRTAWGAAAFEASAWDFDLADITYVGSVPLPNLVSGSTVYPFTSACFTDEGRSFVYSNAQHFYKLTLSTPYDLLSSDLVVASESTTMFSGAINHGQFSMDGRSFFMFYNASGVNNFRKIALNSPFDPFSASASDVTSLTPAQAVTGSNQVGFAANGMSFYLLLSVSNVAELRQYLLDEPFDVSTISATMTTVQLTQLLPSGANNNGLTAFSFSPDGLRLITVGGLGGTGGRVLRMWALRAPWNLSHVTHIGAKGIDANQGTGLSRVFVDPTVTWLYVYAGAAPQRLVQLAINRS